MLVFPVVVRVSESGPVEFQFKANPDGLNKGTFWNAEWLGKNEQGRNQFGLSDWN